MTEPTDVPLPEPEPEAGHTLRRYASALWKGRAWVLSLVVAGVSGGWLRGHLSPDVYGVRTEIDITKQRPFGISPTGGNQVVSFGEGYLESQLHYPTRYKLLESDHYIASLLEATVAPDGSVSYPMWDWLTWPAWSSEFPWKPGVDQGARRSRLEALCGPPIEGEDEFARLTGISGAEFRRRFAFRSYGPAATRSAAAAFDAPGDLRAVLENHVLVEPVKGTALVDIELEGERPALLAPLLNLLIETFARGQRSEGQKRLGIERDLVDTRIREVDGWVDGAGREVPGTLDRATADLKAWIEGQKGSDANKLELRRKVLSSEVEDAEREIRAVSDRLVTRHGELLDLVGPDHVDRTDAEADRANAAGIRRRILEITAIVATSPEGPFHRMAFVLGDPKVAELNAKLAGFDPGATSAAATTRGQRNVAVGQAALSMANALVHDLEIRAAKRDQYDRDLAELERSWKLQNELAAIQAEVDRRAKELRALEDRRETIRTQERVEAGLAPLKVVEPATDPVKPVRPNRVLLLLVGAGVGLLLGLTLALLLDWLDDSVTDPADVERLLHAPVLGTIVAVKPGQEGVREIDRIATLLPRSPVAEAFRAVRTSVEFLGGGGEGGRILLVSSCSPREGKTTVASNLAAVLAQDGKRTLLVDADMRRPRVHHVFEVANSVGLSNVIAGRARLEDAVVGTSQENLWVLPSGATPPNPAELLGRASAQALFERLASEFDRVVVDSPPVGVVTDGAVLGRRADEVLLVIAAGRTKRRAAEHGESLLRSAGAKPTGVVMNQVERGSRFLYGGYYAKDAAAYYGSSDGART